MKCPKCFTERPAEATRCVCGYDYPIDSDDKAATDNNVVIPALLIIIGFFLPWAQLFGQGLSGLQIAKLGSYGNWAWVAPLTAGYVLLRCFVSPPVAGGRLVAGIAPFIGLLYGLSKVGTDLFHVLSIGAYLTLAGAGMLLFQFFSSSSTSSEAIGADTSGPTMCPNCSKAIPADPGYCPKCGWGYKSNDDEPSA
jgi:hypothetical protein